MDDEKEIGFEDAIRELDLLVERLEVEELTLIEALGMFERGQVLLRQCQKVLQAAELKLQQISVEEM